MAFGLRPPKGIADLCGVWLNQVDQRIRSQICVGISASFWSIWLCKNDVTFDGKKIILLFAGYFQGNLLDTFLEHDAKEPQQTTTEVSVLHTRDHGYGDLRQARVVVFQEDRRIMLHLCFGSLFESCGLFLYA
jgi:hypothetical protein